VVAVDVVRREAAAVAEALPVHEVLAPEQPLHCRPVQLQKRRAQARVAGVLGEVELGDVDVAAVEAEAALPRRPHAPRAAVSSAKKAKMTKTTLMMLKASRLKRSDANSRRVTDLPVVAAVACNSNVAALVAAKKATTRRKLK
jgi:hypothetical protein